MSALKSVGKPARENNDDRDRNADTLRRLGVDEDDEDDEDEKYLPRNFWLLAGCGRATSCIREMAELVTKSRLSS